MSQVEKIDGSIKHLKGKVEMFEEAKQLASDLQAQGKVLVDNEPDSEQCVIWAEVPSVTEQLISISQLGFSDSDIKYDYESEMFKTKVVLRE